MREIKFRFYDQFNDEWRYSPSPDYTQFWIDYAIAIEKDNNPSLMQFTGLHDKDGKEIYEGDIDRDEIEFDHGDERQYYICTFIKELGVFTFLCKGDYIGYLHGNIPEDHGIPFYMEGGENVKIIGNIYDNPELL